MENSTSLLQDSLSVDFYNSSSGLEDESPTAVLIKELVNATRRFASSMPEEKEYIFDRLFIRALFFTLYTIVFCSCFFGNLVVMLVVTLHWRMKSSTNFCLANLAFANLCVGVFCVYQNLSTYLITSWVFGDFMCKMYHFINSLSYTASILILVVICIERYLAIIHPIKSRQILTINRLRFCIVAVWITSAIYCSPRLYYITTITIPRHDGEIETLCIPKRTLYDSATFDVINFLLMFLVPLIVISVLYTMIGITLWRSSNNQMAAPSSAAAVIPISVVGSVTAPSCATGSTLNGQSYRNGNVIKSFKWSRRPRNEPVNLNKFQSNGSSNSCPADTPTRMEQRSPQSTKRSKTVGSYMIPCCCFDKDKRQESSGEWGKHRSSSKSNTNNNGLSRPSLVLTDAQEVDHILLAGQDCANGAALNASGRKLSGIPTISMKVDSKLPFSLRNKLKAKNGLSLTSWKDRRRTEKQQSQSGRQGRGGGVGEGRDLSRPDFLPLSPPLGTNEEDSLELDTSFRNNRSNNNKSGWEQKRHTFRIRSRVTAFSTTINESSMRKYSLHSADSNSLEDCNLANGRSYSVEQGSGGSAGARAFRAREHKSGGLKRSGAIKANRIGASALNSRRRVVRMLIVIVVTFAICNLPFHARKLWQIFSSSYRGGSVFSTLFTPITFLIMYANCAINPILYAFMSAHFRQSFRDLLSCRRRQQSSSNMSMNRKSRTEVSTVLN